MTVLAPPGVVVVASQLRTDEKRILDTLDRRRVRYSLRDSREAWEFAPEQRLDSSLVLNREIGQARAYYGASAMEARGARVVNSSAAIELCGDKWRTTLALRQAGLPTPRTALGLTPEAALSALDAIGYPAVVKPLTGSWGRLVAPLHDRRAAEAVLQYVAALPSPRSHIVYVQELVDKPDRDIRVIVVGGEVLGATFRRGHQWRTNVALGGVAEPCPLTAELVDISARAAAAVGADIAGVDLVEDSDGRLMVLEVNHRVEFSGFQRAHGDMVDVAGRIVDLLLTDVASCCA